MERIPIRWRLAGTSAILTLLILLASSVAVGGLLSARIRDDFVRDTRDAARTLATDLVVSASPNGYRLSGISINDFAASQRARIRVLDLSGNVIEQTPGAPDLGLVAQGASEVKEFRLQTEVVPVRPEGHAVLQYARPTAELDRTLARVRLFLGLGVIGGSLLALGAGLTLARRAMRPIDDLTSAAREVEASADPGRTVPVPPAEDEVRKLALTLQSMLAALDREKERTEAALARQREFVADASHELRTPLTALIANLDVVADEVDAQAAESVDAARRSTRRMKKLVEDLLLLARSDSRTGRSERVDLRALVEEACGEVEPLLGSRRISTRLSPALVSGDASQLGQAVVNLVANAVIHTPEGTTVNVSLHEDAGKAHLTVEDDGPGIPEGLGPSVFDRFVRGGGETSGSSGLGLSIVKAVAAAHGGEVSFVAVKPHGARFELDLPVLQD